MADAARRRNKPGFLYPYLILLWDSHYSREYCKSDGPAGVTFLGKGRGWSVWRPPCRGGLLLASHDVVSLCIVQLSVFH